jgi:hypothetical protein
MAQGYGRYVAGGVVDNRLAVAGREEYASVQPTVGHRRSPDR